MKQFIAVLSIVVASLTFNNIAYANETPLISAELQQQIIAELSQKASQVAKTPEVKEKVAEEVNTISEKMSSVSEFEKMASDFADGILIFTTKLGVAAFEFIKSPAGILTIIIGTGWLIGKSAVLLILLIVYVVMVNKRLIKFVEHKYANFYNTGDFISETKKDGTVVKTPVVRKRMDMNADCITGTVLMFTFANIPSMFLFFAFLN